MTLSDRQRALKNKFIDARNVWNPFYEEMLRLDPEFFEAYVAFEAIPWTSGPLEPKVKAFICIAVDASTTHLYLPGMRQHIRKAIEHGATRAELMEVLELTSVLGIHSCTEGVPVLISELAESGQPIDMTLSPLQTRLKEDFIEKRGYWNDFWDGVLVLDPAYFEAYLRFSSVPWTTGTLSPKVKELVYVAIDASTTHLYIPGLRQHVRNALGYGAKKSEIMEVFELASAVGIHSCAEGLPILLEEAEMAGS